MGCSRTHIDCAYCGKRSNNTNKWDAQEPMGCTSFRALGSNNTNKWDAQEPRPDPYWPPEGSNNTNKWDAQERKRLRLKYDT